MHPARCKLASRLCQTQHALLLAKIDPTAEEGQPAEAPGLVLLLEGAAQPWQMAAILEDTKEQSSW